jgi:redox-sensing transcriptional repressor
MDKEDIPKETVERLLFYTKCLSTFKQVGRKQFLSADIAKKLKLKPTLVRKDLSYIGRVGRRGIGYNVEKVLDKINRIVYYKKEHKVALIGVGNIGRALINYFGFQAHGFTIKIAFEKDKEKIGKEIEGVKIEDIKTLKKRVAEEGIKIGIIAVPPIHIKEIIDIVKDSEIKAILNFTPTCLMPYDDLKGKLKIKNIDLAVEMQRLVYYLF